MWDSLDAAKPSQWETNNVCVKINSTQINVFLTVHVSYCTYHGLVPISVVIIGAGGEHRSELLLLSDLVTWEELAELLDATVQRETCEINQVIKTVFYYRRTNSCSELHKQHVISHSCVDNSITFIHCHILHSVKQIGKSMEHGSVEMSFILSLSHTHTQNSTTYLNWIIYLISFLSANPRI